VDPKFSFFKFILVGLIFLSVGCRHETFSSGTHDGGDISGGGSGYESEFRDILEDLIEKFESHGLWLIPTNKDSSFLDVDDIRNALTQTKIIFVKEPLRVMDGGQEREVDASNNPQGRLIKVNIARWNTLKDKTAKERLALHEIFGIMKVEKNIYVNSNKLLNVLNHLEHPKNPEDQCPTEVLGAHDGDACLNAVLFEIDDRVAALQEALLTVSEPRSTDNERTAQSRHRIRDYIQDQKENFPLRRESTCQKVAVNVGNYGAYEENICEVTSTMDLLESLTHYYNQIKAIHPDLPTPRSGEKWSG
jgi:hypothetical protein